MSTFDGIVAEFPQIRIDEFTQKPNHPAPLACFLSHVHSDHLRGLESHRSPFVYCSPATREILLRLERYQPRMNFKKGIVEARVQTYKNLRGRLKTIPLDTPTSIELCPGSQIRVTLLDANHCIGAVMFLIEGNNKAILYTGDIRSETWWVNSLVRNPTLIPYTLGNRRLDRIYLDTTFATKTDMYREFPSKAEGVRELLKAIDRYPPDTIFYFHAWTFGYEDVWTTLSTYLNSRIHLDRYRYNLYSSLSGTGDDPPCPDAARFCGFLLGNHKQQGYVTADPKVRLHSCELSTSCHIFNENAIERVVKIIPIITRTRDGTDVLEVGAGGGQGDLDQIQDLAVNDLEAIEQLRQLVQTSLQHKNPKLLATTLENLAKISEEHGRKVIPLDDDLKAMLGDSDQVFLESLVDVLANEAPKVKHHDLPSAPDAEPEDLPKTVRFPYSRHSSYSELCELVKAFSPKDVYPCTVDVASWDPSRTMRVLFGDLCSAEIFVHDKIMLDKYEEMQQVQMKKRRREETQEDSQLHSSIDRHGSMQDDIVSPDRKRIRTLDGTQISYGDHESFDFTEYATCNTQIRLDDIDGHVLVSFEERPSYENMHDTSQQTVIYHPQDASMITDTSIAATRAAKSQAHLSTIFDLPEPQTPQRSLKDHAISLDSSQSHKLTLSSSPFNRARPATIFDTERHPTCFSKLAATEVSPTRSRRRVDPGTKPTGVITLAEPQPPEMHTRSPQRPLTPSTSSRSRISGCHPVDQYATRRLAHDLASECNGRTWFDFGGLVSAGNNHSAREAEL